MSKEQQDNPPAPPEGGSNDPFEKTPPENRQRTITKDQAAGRTETIRVYGWKALDDMGIDKKEEILADYPKGTARVVHESANGRISDIEIDKSALEQRRKERHIEKYGYAPGAEPVYAKGGKLAAKVSRKRVTGKQIEEKAQAIENAKATGGKAVDNNE